MSSFILAFVVTPAAVVGLGYLAVALNERAAEREKNRHPVE